MALILYLCEALKSLKKALRSHFDVYFQGRSTWNLRAGITQDEQGNIYLDQKRYAASIVQRYISTAVTSAPTTEDLEKYASPLPTYFKWSKEDILPEDQYLSEIETDFGFRHIEVAGSFNCLAHTAVVEILAVKKMCHFTRRPGPKHFKATLHLLHHLRSHPSNAIVFHVELGYSPLMKDWYPRRGRSDMNMLLCADSDSSWGDYDDQPSTGGYMVLFNVSLVDFSSFIPGLVTIPSSEEEQNALAVATAAAIHIGMIMMWFFHGDIVLQYTVPIFCENAATVIITTNERPSCRTPQIERRWLYPRHMYAVGYASYNHVNGDAFMLADLFTKNKSSLDDGVAYNYGIVLRDSPSLSTSTVNSASAMFTT